MTIRPLICHVISGLRTGGAERSLYTLLASPLSERFDSHVISLSGEGSYGPALRDIGVPVTGLDIRRSPLAILQLLRLIRRLRPAILQGWMYHGNLAASICRRFAAPRAALVWNIRHSLYDIRLEKRLTRLVIRANAVLSTGARQIVFNAFVSRDQHMAFGFAAAPARVIPNGFNTERFAPDAARGADVCRALNLPEDAVVIGHVGRHHPMKDHAGFLSALPDVLRPRPNVHIVMTGKDVSFDNPFLAALVPDDLLQRVHMLGERRDVPDLMRAMTIFVQTATSEAFPNVLGEAMASGLACIATDVGDSGAVLADTGLAIPVRDPAALVNAIETLLDDPAHVQTLGHAARARIVRDYPLTKTSETYMAMYEDLMQPKAASL